MCLQGRRSCEQDPLPSQTVPGPQEEAKEAKGLARQATRTCRMSARWSILSTCPSSGYPGMQPGAELSPRQPRCAISRQVWQRAHGARSQVIFPYTSSRQGWQPRSVPTSSFPPPAQPSHCLLPIELSHNDKGERRDGAQAWHPTRVPRCPPAPYPALTRAGGRRSHCGRAGSRRGRC